MSAPVGAVVGIYYDGATILQGEALRTPTGRLYVVVARRVQVRGKYAGRQHLRCVIAAEVSPDTKVLPIHWYKRGKR